jgi:putative ABC transport system permease protein
VSESWTRRALRRLTGFARRGVMETRYDDEARFHIEMATERNRKRGMAPDDARQAALVSFGGRERFKDDARDEYRSLVLDELAQDVRYAIRVLRRNPGFAAATTLTFALGIGAATAVFSIVNGVLLRPLPYAAPDRLAVIWERDVRRGKGRNVVSVPNFLAWRERTRAFASVAALVPHSGSVAGNDRPERVAGAEVSPGYFRLLGVSPALGREFTASEERDGGADVVVLSDGLWRSRFGADPAVLGRAFVLNGRPRTIIGVMAAQFDPPQFGWLGAQSYWLPFAPTEQTLSWGRFLLVVGRLAPSVAIDVAAAEMRGIADQLAKEDARDEGWSTEVIALDRQITGDVRTPLLVLLGAVGLLLLIAITNVANLTLAFTRRREQELAVRRAIGATRGRVARQVLTQSALLGALGAITGVAASIFAVRVLVRLLPGDVPRVDAIQLDGSVLGFATAVTVLATLGFGWVAAIRGTTSGGGVGLQAVAGRASARLRGGALVTAEIALGLVLTVFAGLMVRTFVALRAVDLGFDSESVVVARVALHGDRYRSPEAYQQFFASLLDRIRAVRGVQAASEISTRPFGGMGPATPVFDPARPFAPGVAAPVVDFRYADPEFFRALRVPVLAGGTFGPREDPDGAPRIVINQTLARTLWGSENAIGRQVALQGGRLPAGEVIGVVGDVHLMDARTPPRGTVYFASSQFPSDVRDLIVRGAGDPTALTAAIRSAVAAIDPTLPLFRISTLQGLVDTSLERDRFTTVLLGAFAVASLLLAAVGIYGVFTSDVTQRRKEIGIRLALGANSRGIVGLVLRRALGRALLGVSLGGVAALALGRGMAPMLFGIGSSDPVAFATVAFILLAVALIATSIPAFRATRVSPLIAIRTD